MATPAGFEPTACRLGGDRSILLSYGVCAPECVSRDARRGNAPVRRLGGDGFMTMRLWRTLAAAALTGVLTACTPAPTAEGPPRTVGVRTAAEQQLGDRTHPQIIAQYGGAYSGPVAEYVRGLGQRLAAHTEQPQGPWTFTVLDSPIVNAFALPGGYVYVTRGLIALANDEAQLAGVIGHEMGHVTAVHTAGRQSRAAGAQLGVLGVMIGAAVLGVDGPAAELIAQGAGAVAQGSVASYSRAQELEADRLGVAYLARAGYDPLAQAAFLRAMQAQDALSAQLAGGAYDPNRVDFFASHPATGERIRAAEAEAQRAPGGADRNRDAFLRAINGMTYGDSAAQGFVRGDRFIHPELRFAFQAPQGFAITNAAEQVTMRGPRGASVTFDSGRDPGGALQAYVAQVWAGGLARQTRTGALQREQRFTIDGMEAASAVLPVQTNRGVGLAHMTAIRAGDGRLYRFLGFVDASDAGALAEVEAAARSFRRLSAAQAARERPWRLSVVTVRPGDSVASLAARMPFDRAREERFRVLNGLAPGQGVRPGDRVKLVLP